MTSTHTSNRAWDAIVVVGGPAGTSAARPLAAAGTGTKKAQHPRYKACGGGVPLHTLRLLDTPVDAVVGGAVDALGVTRFGALGFSKRSAEPFALMVMRDRIDALLLDGAEMAGAIVRQGGSRPTSGGDAGASMAGDSWLPPTARPA